MCSNQAMFLDLQPQIFVAQKHPFQKVCQFYFSIHLFLTDGNKNYLKAAEVFSRSSL